MKSLFYKDILMRFTRRDSKIFVSIGSIYKLTPLLSYKFLANRFVTVL